jgi:LysM repeat protein
MRLFLSFLIVFVFSLSAQAAQVEDERAFDNRTHVVQPKETLYKISRQYGVSVSAIKKVNKLNSDIIAAGARLAVKVPKDNDVFQVHIVRYDEDLAGISEKYLLPTDILTKYNDFDENVVFPGQRIFIKIDKINTKYTYKGEEDNPITDAEIGGNDLRVNNGTNATPTQQTPQEQSASAGANTPVYVFNTQNQQQSRLKDSLPAGDKAFTLEGYLDAYYALFSDAKNKGDLSEYAMSAPKHGQTNINNIQLAAIYNDTNLRGNITLQYGDLPNAVYPTDFKYLQQANVGFKIAGPLWLDAGYFKSPVSVEDFPNKTNYSSIYSYTRFFEPVLWSGAKLGLEFNNFKFSVFASDRTFSIGNVTNTNPTFGFNMKIYGGKHWLLGMNGMYTQINVPGGKQNRAYGNVFVASNRKHLDVLAYANVGLQQNNTFMSGVVNIRYKITSKFSLFTRGEYFTDSSAVVSPLMIGTDGKQQGLTATALSGGFEFKARANHYLRIEARNTQTANNFKVYKDYMNHNGAPTNQRWELVITTGIWFGK